MQALMQFFAQMPADNGMAFVVITHLSPTHESHAAAILQRVTPMPVDQVLQPVAIEPNHVYVISPGHSLSMTDGHLMPGEEERVHGRNVAIDTFFRVLAQVRRSRAVGIVLSGTGSDGAVGLQRIREQGGVTLAQTPGDAQHDGMPRAAIDTGIVDFVLPVTDMPAKLIELAANAAAILLPDDAAEKLDTRMPALPGDAQDAEAEAALREIMALLRSRTRHDFHHYKRPTVLRRLERRMQVTVRSSLPAYCDYLREHPEETAALLQDMLISVTHFFRDHQAFEALERDVLPPLFQRIGSDRPLRAWVVGCASGEEAYSLAMLLEEAGEQMPVAPSFQVFASDIDERALARARYGLYPKSIIADVAPARLRKFFTLEHKNHYRVTKSLRERVLFAHHNVLSDPPFSRIDLVLCRNLLIYFDRHAQAAAFDIFRFVLNRDGALFLGSSESAESASRHFRVIDKKNRIYQLCETDPFRPAPTVALETHPRLVRRDPGARPPESTGPSYAELHQRVRGDGSAPSLLIDAGHRIVHMSADVARYLQVPTGRPSQQLLDNVHPQLRLAVRMALFRARPPAPGALAQAVDTQGEIGNRRIRLTVQPVSDKPGESELWLVMFEDIGAFDAPQYPQIAGNPAEPVVRELEGENRLQQQQLQEVIDHAEASTEELMSSNEELQALNEELRSTTEELETGREELQSTNEELITVNSELAFKIEETSRINDDLQNLVNANDIATVFVDREMRIKRYTPRATELFNLIAADLGRSLQDITHRLDYERLFEDAQAAFESLRLIEREVRSADGRHFMARLLPYRTAEDHIDGAILSFVDVSALRASQDQARASAEQLRLAVESTRDFAILTIDAAGLVTGWNPGAERLFGYSAQEMLGHPMAPIYTDEDRLAGVPDRELAQAREQVRSEDERWLRRKDGSVFYCSGVTTRLEGGRGFAKIARDLTGSKQSALARERQLSREQAGRREAEATMQAKELFLAVMSHELKHPLNLIHLNAELLARMPEIRNVPAATRAARIIQQTVAGQAKIIDDLLDLSRARTGKLTLDRAPVDWADTVRRIVEALRPEAQAQGVSLHFQPGRQPTLSLFDPVRAEQVVWNLLNNAVKFTPDGGSVRVLLSIEDEQARLTVTDTGRGIEPAFLDSVFDMFSQEPGSRRHPDDGMGIGLALVRELVQAHGGRVQARSDGPGRGAEFSIWVPLYRGPAPTAVETGSPSVLRGMKLLVVDDSPDSVESLALLLDMAGARVSRAISGQEALASIAREPCDLIVSDVSMPGMSGHELIAAVRAREHDGQHVLALACSGYGRAQDERRAIESGFDALIAKPASLENIESSVAALLKERAAAAD
jgi:two-component system CheB/CheR fusion protein